MPIRTGRDLHVRSEAGFSLVELLVAAMILVTAVIGIFTALEAAGRAGSEERHRGVAYQLAQEDQARLRAIKITSLLGLNQTRPVTIDGITYSVKSTSKITTDATGTESCDTGSASADYLNITSTVTWPTMGTKSPVVIQSIITPPSGSFDANAGALAISVQNGQGAGVPNVPLTGSGAGSFTGTTGDSGCAVFANLPEGTYTVTPTATGLVDQDGNAPAPVPASVVSQATNTKVLQLDRPGSIDVTFQTKGPAGLQPSMTDELMVFNTGMTTAENFGTLGTRLAKITASPLFPFSSPDSVYAGTCTNNTPSVTSPLSAIASVPVNAGGPVSNALITLPAMDITVRTGTSSSSPGSLMNNAKVVITDKGCSPNVKRTLFTNSSGKLPDPGLPWSTFDICVSGQVSTNNFRLTTRTGIVVKNPNTPTVVPTIYLGGGSFTNSTGCT